MSALLNSGSSAADKPAQVNLAPPVFRIASRLGGLELMAMHAIRV